jgi:hypothetical protein
MPQEWLDPVIWLLADDLETEYPVNDAGWRRRSSARPHGSQAGARLLGHGDDSLFMQPDFLC